MLPVGFKLWFYQCGLNTFKCVCVARDIEEARAEIKEAAKKQGFLFSHPINTSDIMLIKGAHWAEYTEDEWKYSDYSDISDDELC